MGSVSVLNEQACWVRALGAMGSRSLRQARLFRRTHRPAATARVIHVLTVLEKRRRRGREIERGKLLLAEGIMQKHKQQ